MAEKEGERGQRGEARPPSKGSFSADRKAPVFAAGEIEVVAPAQLVWDVVAQVEDWPKWNAGITEVSLDGPITPGTTFSWKAGRSKITSTFREVNPPHTVGWTGKTFGVKATHVWEIRPSSGGVTLRTEESWRGVLAGFLRKKLNTMLAEAVQKSLDNTKAEAERRAGAD
jgi:hypothetical protein